MIILLLIILIIKKLLHFYSELASVCKYWTSLYLFWQNWQIETSFWQIASVSNHPPEIFLHAPIYKSKIGWLLTELLQFVWINVQSNFFALYSSDFCWNIILIFMYLIL